MSKPLFKKVILTKDLLDGWKRQDQANHRAVVFVHGFIGTPEATWKAPNASKSFPELLLDDEAVGDFDIYRFKYKSNPFSGPGIKNIARQLETEIVYSLAGYQLLLLAHSMGGLVCMEYIVNRLEKGDNLPVIGLLMFGTPTTGVEWVNIARLVLEIGGLRLQTVTVVKKILDRNSHFKELSVASQFLQDLQSNWILRVVNGGYPTEPANRRAWVPVRVVTGNEDWVVKEHSAKGVYGQIDWNPVQLDHRSLVKPASLRDVSYKRTAEFLAQCRDNVTGDVLQGLRFLSDWVWSLRQTKLIRDWKLDITFFEADQRPSGSTLQLEGFSLCEVKCRYTLLLPEKPFVFGLTLGQDASKTGWKGNPAYLHQIYLDSVRPVEREQISKTLRLKLIESPNALEALFEGVQMRIAEAGKEDWCDLVRVHTESSAAYLLAYFDIPEVAKPLVGKEVTLDLGFRSFRPNALCEFTLQFPWLTAGFDALIVIQGRTEYIVTSSQVFGQMKPVVSPPEDFGEGFKIRINGDKNVVLPGSSVHIEWLPV
jgi:pimeloyl-ACP methyl ester carboxylesterase